MRWIIALLLLTAATPVPRAAISVSLPDEDGVFADLPGAPADAMNENCLGCHSAAMVTRQPRLTEKQWADTVAKMRNVYKAPIDPAADAAIIKWVTTAQAD
jgi:cytochrome c553